MKATTQPDVGVPVVSDTLHVFYQATQQSVILALARVEAIP
jgi:hypothetical protein